MLSLQNETTDARPVLCWGMGTYGNLGEGTSTDNVGEPSASVMVIDSSDGVTTLGFVDDSQYHATGPNDVKKIVSSVSHTHSCALSYEGHVKNVGDITDTDNLESEIVQLLETTLMKWEITKPLYH